MAPVQVLDSCILCAVGRGTAQAWATVRAGIGRIELSSVMDRHFDPIAMGLVPEDELEPLPANLDALPLPSRARRMLRLGMTPLRAVGAGVGPAPIALFLGLPRLQPNEASWLTSFVPRLAEAAELRVDLPRSRIVAAGRAAGLLALEAALAELQQGRHERVIVGGVDTFLDLRLLAELDAEERILGPRVMDGFVPGEGAGFLVLGRSGGGPDNGRLPLIVSAASASDPGHRYGTEPARGEGLAQAIEILRGRVPTRTHRVGTVFAGLNGESGEAKLWGVARLRHTDFFMPAAVLEHPADCMGDTGAAAGAILLAMAAAALANGDRPSPALIWAASDHAPRACALLATEQK